MNARWLLLLLGGVLVSLSVARGGDDPVPPKFTCKFTKAEDEFSSSSGPDAFVLRVASKSGIGGAKFTQTEGDVPARLKIQFVHMNNLESFAVSDGTITLGGSLGCDLFFDKDGKAVDDKKDAVYSLKIQRSKGDKKDIEAIFTPPAGKPNGKEWRADWIDAFRR
jgi:hypothetical protein